VPQGSNPLGLNHDPQASADEVPVHAVTLSPFFLSKYEMTQGQWLRLAGANPSLYGPHNHLSIWSRSRPRASLLHPVEQVTWTASVQVLGRLGLSLPSEAQWEYACRGGTESVFWSGGVESLQGVANLSDRHAKANGNELWTVWEAWLDDGETVHAEVGSYRANACGLHDVHGNVWEWCLDGYSRGFYQRSGTHDPLSDPESSVARVSRGGAFLSLATHARSAYRNVVAPTTADSVLGLRPARRLQASAPSR
jgi:formylglycine-generating enzyme required for sulfatase activity